MVKETILYLEFGMKILFYLVHPGHYHLFKNVIKNLNEIDYEIIIIIRPKENLEQLLLESGYNYIKINDGVRGKNKWAMFSDMVQRDFRAYHLIKKIKQNISLKH